MLIETDQGEREVNWPVLSLYFDYDGRRVRARTLEPGLLDSSAFEDFAFRDERKEANAQRLLERFGALEIDCVEGCVPPYGSEANYLVTAEPNAHAACSFSAQALPELEKHGFRIEIDPDYPYQIIDPTPDWYGKLEPSSEQLALFGDERTDWFSLELGIVVDGEHCNLVPALVDRKSVV